MGGARVKSSGLLLASMLTGSWRTSPPEFQCPTLEIEEIAPLLPYSGAAALCWWRIKHSNPRLACRSAKTLHQAYRANTLQAALHQRTIEQAINILHSGGIELVLVKCWAIARLYPQQAWRPYGDIDLG